MISSLVYCNPPMLTGNHLTTITQQPMEHGIAHILRAFPKLSHLSRCCGSNIGHSPCANVLSMEKRHLM